MSNIFVNCCTNDSSSRLCALWHFVCTLFVWENTRIREQSFAEQPTTAAWFEKVQRAKKRQNIFKSGSEIYFSFCVENGLFSALCHLSRPENGAKVQNRVGFGVFWVPDCKNGQKHRMNIICGSEKKCGTEFEKANWASKRRVAFRLLYVIAASLPVLKPAEFAFFLRQRIRIQERHWRTAAAKSGGIWSVLRAEAFVCALTAGCFLSGSVHFSFRIAVIECNWSLRSSNRLRTSAVQKIAGKELKMFDKESVSFHWK